jgi:O-antigen/teichoic acid export membrane protein
MNRSRIVLRSIIATYVYFIVQMGVTFITVPIALHHVGETEYGRWVGLGSIAGWAGLAEVGVSGLLIAKLSRRFENNELTNAARELWHGLVIAAISAIVGAVVLAAVGVIFVWSAPESFRLSRLPFFAIACLAGGVACSQFANALAALQHARLSPVSTALAGIVASVVSLAASICLLPWLGAAALAVGQLARAFLYAAPLAVWNSRFLLAHLPSLRFDRAFFIPFLSAGASGLGVRWLQCLLGTFDIFTVSMLRGPDRAAMYANTAKPVGMAVGMSSSFGSAIMPSFSRYSAGRGGAAAYGVFMASARTVLAVCGGLAMVFVGAYAPLLSAWIGPDFVLAPPLVVAIAVAAVAQAWLGFVSFLFGGTGRFTTANIILLVEGITRIGLMTVGMFTGGIFGMAVCAALTQVVAVVWYAITVARLNGVSASWPSLAGLVAEFAVVAVSLSGASLLSNCQLPLAAAIACSGTLAAILFGFLTMREQNLRSFLIAATRQAFFPARNAT